MGRDLTVIVFDNKAGYLYSKAFNAGGHYYWKNYEHIVTTSTFDYKGESDWNALVLSEEISHFVLRYLGYPQKIWGDGTDTSYVHANRNKFLECKTNNDLYSTECSKTWTTIEGRALRSDGTGYYVATFRVLAPYDKPVSESCPSGYIYNSNDRSCYLDKPTPVQPKDTLTLLGLSYEINGEKKTYGKEGDRLCLTYHLNDYLKRNMDVSTPVPFKQIKVEKTILDVDGNPITYPALNHYTTDTSGKVIICEELNMYSTNYWKNGYKYDAFFETKDGYTTHTPTLTIFFEQKQNTASNTAIEKELRAMEEDIRVYENTLNEKIVEIINAYWESEQKFSTSNAKNRMKLAFEKASSINGKIASTLYDSFRIYDAALYDKRYDDAMEIQNNVNVFCDLWKMNLKLLIHM